MTLGRLQEVDCMNEPDLSRAPEIIRRYYANGTRIPERYWKIVAAGMPWSEVVDGEITNLDAFNASRQ